MRKTILTVFVIALAVAGCAGKYDGTRGLPLATSGERLVIAATDYSVGRLDALPLSGGVVVEGVQIHADAIVRVFGGKPFVVNRDGADNIQIFSADLTRTVAQYKVGDQTNAQDILVVDDGTAYVSRHRATDLLKIDPRDGRELGRISLVSHRDLLTGKTVALADEDGFPEMAWMTREGTKLLVQLQRLDRKHRPVGQSYVVVIDMSSDTVEKVMPLTRPNPFSEFKRGPAGTIYVATVGTIGVPDGAIEGWKAEGFRGTGVVVGEKELGGDILDFEVLAPEKGVAIVAAGKTTGLVSFDPSTGKRGETLLETAEFALRRILWDRDGNELYVADGTLSRPAIRVFDVKTLKEKTSYPLRLPPYHMARLP